ncbi:shTK domain protein [Teladorsagia circumcincta]|uniref:ShTK domain protein n=1 Tax=Teladorsagia circumcincta TaxID=45464 RepID=A0A2G9TTI1_TELCI|nr:shTK domain protein [Teladorsagia circumcincta]
MIFYLLCAMLIINAFARDDAPLEECKDRGNERYCNSHKTSGHCESENYKFIMKANCRKTCNLCDQ